MLNLESVHLPGRNNPIFLEGTLPISEPDALEMGLREGQIVRGVIEARGDSMTLVMNGKAFDLPPGLAIPRGMVQWFKSIATKRGIELKAIPKPQGALVEANSSSKASANTGALSSRALSLMFRSPQPSSILSLFKPGFMEALLQNAGSSQFLNQFRAMQLNTGALTGSSLQRAVANSGLWTEATLANGQSPSPIDTKTWFRQLIRILPAGSEALTVIENGIDDLEASQIEAVQAQAQREVSFSLVLPFSDRDPVELSFYRPPPSEEEKNPAYTVNIHSDSDDIGEVWLKTSVTNKTKVDLMMWAVKEDIAELAKSSADELKRELESAGLTMISFTVFNSRRPNLPDRWTSPGSVVNVQA